MDDINWWQDAVFNQSNLDKLIKNKISSIVIESFAEDSEHCQLIQDIESLELSEYAGITPVVKKYGVTQFDGNLMGKQWYFDQAEKLRSEFDTLFRFSYHPVRRFIDLFKEKSNYEVEIARESNRQLYFPAVIREANNSVEVHADFARFNQEEGWFVNNFDFQLAWNLFLSSPMQGGESVIYQMEANSDYNTDGLKSVGAKVIAPTRKSLVIFNSKNFHMVVPSVGCRLTIGGFLGGNWGTNKIYMWC